MDVVMWLDLRIVTVCIQFDKQQWKSKIELVHNHEILNWNSDTH